MINIIKSNLKLIRNDVKYSPIGKPIAIIMPLLSLTVAVAIGVFYDASTTTVVTGRSPIASTQPAIFNKSALIIGVIIFVIGCITAITLSCRADYQSYLHNHN